MQAVSITLLSLALTTAVLGNAYYQKKQFYPSVVYITKSNPSMAVIYVQAFILVFLMGKLMRKVFFGQLRAAEFEHLMERSWYAVTETCLAFTVFRDDFSPKFVALFTVLLFLKSFHWLAEDRVDFMERSPVISWLFHVRVLSLLTMLGALDLHFVGHAYHSTITKGASVQLVFGFEYAILLTIIVNIAIKYALHTIDLNSENPWDNKAVFLLYTELVMGFFKVFLYIAFVAIMVRIYTLPLFAFRPMYYTMRAFKKAFNDVILSRRAIRNMNTLYPDATPEELAAADNVCIICREEMISASKKLPCNHIFHTSCLRSWFQRQQTCPTCRLNILRTPTSSPTQNTVGPIPQPAQPQGQQAPGMPWIPPPVPGGNPGAAFPFPFWQPFQQPFQQPPVPAAAAAAATGGGGNAQEQGTPQQGASGSTNGTAVPNGTTGAGSTSSGTVPSGGGNSAAPPSPPPPPPPGFFYPPLPFMPFALPTSEDKTNLKTESTAVPPPMPPPNLATLSSEELKRMEGTTRESIEARLQCLRNIQMLLDASVMLMLQYSSAAAAAAAATAAAAAAAASSPSAQTSSNMQSQTSKPTEDKVTTTVLGPDTETSPGTSSASNISNLDGSPGATVQSLQGPSSPTGTSTASPLTKEQEEIRRRRLEKFGQNAE